MFKIVQPPFASIPTAAGCELANYTEFFHRESKFLRARLPDRIHIWANEIERLLEHGWTVGRPFGELIAAVIVGTFYHWFQDETRQSSKSKLKGGRVIENLKPIDVG